MNTEVNLKDRIHGMYLGVAIGDALGMPVETMKAPEIARLNNGMGVIGYMDPCQTRVEHTRNMHAGDTTDDWQLTRAVSESLSALKGFNIHHQARTHIEAMERSVFGWGKGTTRSLEEIRDGRRTADSDPLWPIEMEKPSAGNGIIMKVSPLAAMAWLTGKDMTDEILALGRMTHLDMRARIAPVAVYQFLLHALTNGTDPGHANWLERIYFSDVLNQIGNLEDVLMKYENPEERFFLSRHLIRADITSIQSLVNSAGVGFTAWQTAAFTLGVYRRYPTDFNSAVLEAVNAGGDTDTNASVVGALVGATIGFEKIPSEWKRLIPLVEIEETATSLFEAFRQG
jgi:ADP-ribosylglycohydrolase